MQEKLGVDGAVGRGRMRICLVAVLTTVSFLISGCGGSLTPTYTPVALTENSAFTDDVASLRAELGGLEPEARLIRGMTIADTRCDKFFEDLEALRSNARFARNRVNSLGTGLPPLLKAAEASSFAVAAVAAATGFVQGWISDYEELYLLSRFQGAVYKDWQLAKFDAEKRIHILISAGDVPDSIADRELYKYTRLCLRSQLVMWVDQAANAANAKPKAPTSDAGTTDKPESTEDTGEVVGDALVPPYIIE